jgi:AcrR family transcriptional regulator
VATQRQLTDQGRERKQQLLDAAAGLFAEHGYASTRIVDICSAAGVAKGLFYWYFENKEALFAELVRSMRLRLRVAHAEAIDLDADPLVRIRQGTEASVRFMAQHRAFFSLLEVEQRSNSLAAVLREGTEIHASDTARLVKEAQAEGVIPEDGE